MSINQEPTNGHRFTLPKYVVISYLTIFSIGSQYFINLSYLFSQVTIQDTFGFGTYGVVVPTVLSYLAFATFLVIGPVVAKQFGFRRMYLFFVLLLCCGSLSALFAPNSVWFDIGRFLQGAGSGALYMVMVPLVAISIPTKRRNWFILIILSGLFGATGLGGIFGGLSLARLCCFAEAIRYRSFAKERIRQMGRCFPICNLHRPCLPTEKSRIRRPLLAPRVAAICHRLCPIHSFCRPRNECQTPHHAVSLASCTQTILWNRNGHAHKYGCYMLRGWHL